MLSHPTYQAMIDLGNRANIPVFAARYKADFSEWHIIPLNGRAKEILPNRETYTEREWITFLYNLRGYEPPENRWDSEGVLV